MVLNNSTFNLPAIIGRTIFGMLGEYIGQYSSGVLPKPVITISAVVRQGTTEMSKDYGNTGNRIVTNTGAATTTITSLTSATVSTANMYCNGWFDGDRVVPASVGMMFVVKY